MELLYVCLRNGGRSIRMTDIHAKKTVVIINAMKKKTSLRIKWMFRY